MGLKDPATVVGIVDFSDGFCTMKFVFPVLKYLNE